MPDRRAQRLLTLDRALLLAAIAVGSWIAAKDFNQGDFEKRLQAQEQSIGDMRSDETQLKIDRAVLSAQLQGLTEEVRRLREVIERGR